MIIDQANQIQGLSSCYNLNNCGLTTTSSGELALSSEGLSSLLSSVSSNDSSFGVFNVISKLVDLVVGLFQRIFGPSESIVSESNTNQVKTESNTNTSSEKTSESTFNFKDLIEIGKDALSIISGRKSITGTFKSIASAIKKISSWF